MAGPKMKKKKEKDEVTIGTGEKVAEFNIEDFGETLKAFDRIGAMLYRGEENVEELVEAIRLIERRWGDRLEGFSQEEIKRFVAIEDICRGKLLEMDNGQKLIERAKLETTGEVTETKLKLRTTPVVLSVPETLGTATRMKEPNPWDFVDVTVPKQFETFVSEAQKVANTMGVGLYYQFTNNSARAAELGQSVYDSLNVLPGHQLANAFGVDQDDPAQMEGLRNVLDLIRQGKFIEAYQSAQGTTLGRTLTDIYGQALDGIEVRANRVVIGIGDERLVKGKVAEKQYLTLGAALGLFLQEVNKPKLNTKGGQVSIDWTMKKRDFAISAKIQGGYLLEDILGKADTEFKVGLNLLPTTAGQFATSELGENIQLTLEAEIGDKRGETVVADMPVYYYGRVAVKLPTSEQYPKDMEVLLQAAGGIAVLPDLVIFVGAEGLPMQTSREDKPYWLLTGGLQFKGGKLYGMGGTGKKGKRVAGFGGGYIINGQFEVLSDVMFESSKGVMGKSFEDLPVFGFHLKLVK